MDATLELKHFLTHPLGSEVRRTPLTADASSAVHQHPLLPENVKVFVNVAREVTEFPDVWC